LSSLDLEDETAGLYYPHEIQLLDKPAYTVAEVSALTGFSERTVIRMFEQEKGVLIVERPESLHKRRYRSIRIPHAVYERVVRRISV
jgi:hypothetical protein